jgi:DNA repair protein RadC
MRKRYLDTGLKSFAEHEVIELILFGAVSRGDVNPLAHKLLNEFGSISNLLSAPVESIMRVTGAKESVAATLKLIPDVYRYAQLQHNEKDTFPEPESWVTLFRKAFDGETREHFYMLCLDKRYCMESLKSIGAGTDQNAVFEIKDILKEALFREAKYVVIAHNHPNNSLEPSKHDLYTTERVRSALNQVDVKLLDHLIITEDGYKSIMYSGYSISSF